jgi:N-acetylglutamate synthase-like GNAT family acetyltransferase
MGAGEAETLSRIDLAARSRYLTLAGFERFALSPPIASDRFATGCTIVVEQGGQPVGFALIHEHENSAYLANISVLPNASGVGSMLLAKAEEQAAKFNCNALTLATFKLSKWNGPWFRRYGYSTMPGDQIKPMLQAILARHATFLDMSTRETLWKKLLLTENRRRPEFAESG